MTTGNTVMHKQNKNRISKYYRNFTHKKRKENMKNPPRDHDDEAPCELDD